MDVIDGITLQFLANKNHYQKYVEKNEASKVVIRDLDFYKERFIELTKCICHDKTKKPNPPSANVGEIYSVAEEECSSVTEVEDAFNRYADACITYFQFIDRNVELQKEYDGIADESPEVSADIKNPESYDVNATNKIIMNTPSKKCTLDSFVNKPDNKPKKKMPVKRLPDDELLWEPYLLRLYYMPTRRRRRRPRQQRSKRRSRPRQRIKKGGGWRPSTSGSKMLPTPNALTGHFPSVCAFRKKRKFGDTTCFEEAHLHTLAKAWNKKHPNDHIKAQDPKGIHKELTTRMRNVCRNEKCWTEQEFAKDLFLNNLTIFAPVMPEKWLKNMTTWLDSNNIRQVMKPYEKLYKDFIFLGPAPIDFAEKDETGTCLVSDHLCNFDLRKMHKAGKTRIGIIFNTDPSHRGGRHWFAMFITIVDIKKRIEVEYYDSTNAKIQSEIHEFVDSLRNQFIDRNIVVFQKNDKSEQRGTSECGMFCILFILDKLQFGMRQERSDDDAYNARVEFFDASPTLARQSTPTRRNERRRIRKTRRN